MPLSAPRLFDRRELWNELRARREAWDLIVVGGGATGVGVALDAATRGYSVALLEQNDFGKATSSRSTKLIHGGVRYLQQGNVTLVRDALRERGLLLRNAPHLVYPLPTIVPAYRWFERTYYGLGLKAYDLLAGRLGIAASRRLSKKETIAALPTIRRNHLRGGVRYYDAGFNDARLLLAIAQLAVARGAACLNYARVAGIVHQNGRVSGVEVEDAESGESLVANAKVVVNAAGPFSDQVRQMDEPDASPIIAPSQGVHLVVGRRFLPGDSALVIPKTSDGRVVFAIPWQGRTIIGTTDTPSRAASLEPVAHEEEIEFLLETIGRYLQQPPQRGDVLAVFAGIRPLVRREGTTKTSRLGRDHQIRVSDSGLISVLGGKWTTYRKMAEDAVDRAIKTAGLPGAPSRTAELSLLSTDVRQLHTEWIEYGDVADDVRRFCRSEPHLVERLDDALPFRAGQVVWAVRREMAQSVEDILARRLRALFLDATAALRAAPKVAKLAAAELGRDESWANRQLEDFRRVAKNYLIESAE